jgi:hypothetical protein
LVRNSFLLESFDTWGTPDKVAETTFVSHKQTLYRVEIQAWSNMLMCGGKKLADTPISFYAGEYPLIQPSRAIPEATLIG